MSRNLESEIDNLRNEVMTLSKAVKKLTETAGNEEIQTMPRPPKSPEAEEMRKKLNRAYELHEMHPEQQGMVSYFGYFEAEGRGSYWDAIRGAGDLLRLDDEKVAKVLSALGSKQRLAILKQILRSPSTAAELVEKLELGTTGQVYHHLKALQSADLIRQAERGVYVFKEHRVQSLLMLLSGVADALDDKYSSGSWDDESTES